MDLSNFLNAKILFPPPQQRNEKSSSTISIPGQTNLKTSRWKISLQKSVRNTISGPLARLHKHCRETNENGYIIQKP